MSNKNLKKYVGVKFSKYANLNDVIPRKWLTDNNHKAKWPSKSANIEQLARQCEDPKDKWKAYDVEILCHGS